MHNISCLFVKNKRIEHHAIQDPVVQSVGKNSVKQAMSHQRSSYHLVEDYRRPGLVCLRNEEFREGAETTTVGIASVPPL